jgi:hypothetical protein
MPGVTQLEDLTGFRKQLQAIITPYSTHFTKNSLYENLSGLISKKHEKPSQRLRRQVLPQSKRVAGIQSPLLWCLRVT